jgi:shikimate kinase
MLAPVAGIRTVWLVGMMGAGKSSLGPQLAARLGRRFYDSDDEVARRAGCSVPEIFAQKGEAAFRRLERACIEALAGEGAVVALGGGAIAQPGTARRLAELGWVVYLKASAEQLLARLGEGEGRPLLAGLDEVERLARLRELLELRRGDYETAVIQIESGDDGRVGEVVSELARRIEALEREGTGGATASGLS